MRSDSTRGAAGEQAGRSPPDSADDQVPTPRVMADSSTEATPWINLAVGRDGVARLARESPPTCPHGNVIPGRTPPLGRRLIRVTELEDGDQARVAQDSRGGQNMRRPQLLHLLDERGIVPGIEIGLVSRSPGTWNLTVADTHAAVDAATARAIWVEAPNGRAG